MKPYSLEADVVEVLNHLLVTEAGEIGAMVFFNNTISLQSDEDVGLLLVNMLPSLIIFPAFSSLYA